MARVNRFEDLDCWQAARELVKTVYLRSMKGPLSKDFDTRSQIRRAALGGMNNIAEGFARFTDKDFLKFLNYSQSSTSEVKSMLYVLEDLEYLEPEQIKELHDQADKTLNLTLALIRYLNNKGNT